MTHRSDADGDDVRDLIVALYRIFLGRAPDVGGLAFYTGRMKDGMSPAELVESFAASAEHGEFRRRDLAAGTAAADEPSDDFPPDYMPPGEAGKSYAERRRSGFLRRYCGGPVVLDVGFTGYDNPGRKAALPKAVGVDLDYPGYDGTTLPFADGSVDTVFSSHCLEHILFDHAAIRDWHRVLKVGGFIVCMVPSQALYERRRFLPSSFNADHKRMYAPSNLAAAFETALPVNGYRVRHLAENDRGFDYSRGPELHARGAYEIEIVVEKIEQPAWTLA